VHGIEDSRLYQDGKTYAEISKALCGGKPRTDRAGRRAFSDSALSNRAKILNLPPRGRGWKPAAPEPTISLEALTASMQASGLTLNDFKDEAKGRFGG
jgi:hypothetical protein